MQFLFALVVAASLPVFGAESTNAPVKAELDSAPEARPPASAVQITQRLRRISDGWVLSEQDREKLSITVTNQWQGKVCASPTVRKLSAHGLFLQHESGAFWCGWAQLPAETRDKYQAIVAEAQRKNRNADVQMVSDMPVVTDVSAPASSDPKPGKSAYVPESDSEKSVSHSEKRANSDSEKTVYVKGHFQNGKWVQPYYRRPPRSKK